MTSSRQSARPIATRSEIWRGFWNEVPAARTGAESAASNVRAIVRLGGVRRTGRTIGRDDRRAGCGSGGSFGITARLLRRGRCVQSCTRSPRGPDERPYAPGERAPGRRQAMGGSPRPPASLEPDDHGRVRLPRPGVPVGRHGPRPRRRRARPRAAVFAAADAALGESISTLAWDGPAEELDRTENAQPALLAASIAYHAALHERWDATGQVPEPAFIAGHSMGQYSAMVAARGARARRRGPSRPPAWSADAGLRGRSRGTDGRDHRPRRRSPAGARRRGRGPRRLRGRQPQLAGPGRGIGRANGRRGRAGPRPGAGSETSDRAARLRGRPFAAHGRGRRGDAGRAGRGPVRRPVGPAPRQPRRATRSPPARRPGPSSSSISPRASTGSGRSRSWPPPG